LAARVAREAARTHVQPGPVAVQDLGFRWGSCGKGRRLYFHWQSILLPPRIIDYIVVHELVHLREPHHTPAFWRAVERALPDWEARRRWLAEHGREAMI
jgi:predicted metal-dependent hydrolase